MLTRSRSAGLSLVELMVGVALVALILAMGVPSVQVALQNRQIRSAAESIQAGLQQARMEALRRNRPVKFELISGVTWKYGCNPADTTLAADGQQECPAELQKQDNAEGAVNVSLATAETVAASGAAASTAVFDGSITFSSIGRVASASLGTGNVAHYRISNPAGGTCAASGGEMRCLDVQVSGAGQVRMCDPAASSPDPRAC